MRISASGRTSDRQTNRQTRSQRIVVTGFFICLGFFCAHLTLLDIRTAITMAVTEAGCDLTYCKMRGIVAVLTGELQRH